MAHKKQFTIPEEVRSVSDTLQENSFEAFLVGGCVRDLIAGNKPKDWDIATNAKPEEVQALFSHTYYENRFGTVGVVHDETQDERLKHIEVTTYRLESPYSDNRHPDTVTFSNSLQDDLKRRDFTMNAIALNVPMGANTVHVDNIVDPHGGLNDIENGSIQTVGEPSERFGEDALRMLRAVRFAAELDFVIARTTGETIQNMAQQIDKIASERVRDELSRIVMSSKPKLGIELLHDLGLLTHIIPELEEGIDIEQNQAHSFTVWEHLLRSLQATADKEWDVELRLSALLHDIGKPRTRRRDAKKKDWSFHGHEVVGAQMTRKILKRLRFSKDTVETVTKLVRWHMFFSDPDQITLSAVRRMIRNVGTDNIWDLMNIRIADRIGTGRPKEQPYRFRKYKSMIEEVLRDPVTVEMLSIDGSSIMKLTGETPGPKIGWILHALLEEVLDDPKKNTSEYLLKKAEEFAALPGNELQKKAKRGESKKQQRDEQAIQKIRSKYYVE